LELATARLKLDALRPEDAPALFAYRADPAVARYQGWRPADAGEALAFVEAQAAASADGPGWFQRAIRLRENGVLVGDLGIHLPPDAAAAAEVGISIAPAWQRRGYAGEALRAALELIFGRLGRPCVRASVDPRNLASVALLRSLGMRQEALHRHGLQLHGEWVDDAVYILPAEAWRADAPQAAHSR
jgi:RimJ/RimL family protein N-acetyltransferase